MTRPAVVTDRLEFLDALRGIAALAVLLEHSLAHHLPGYLAWSNQTFTFGQAGVCLFFLISGFIIPISLEKGGSNSVFWWRRFWRLFPLYWLTVALAFVVQPTNLSGKSWLINLTMLQEFLGQPHVLGVFWTLSLELVLYLGCSLLFRLGLLKKTVLLLTLAVGGYLLLSFLELFIPRPMAKGRTFLLMTALFGLAVQRFTTGSLRGKGLAVTWIGLVLGLSLAALGDFRHAITPTIAWVSVLKAWVVAYAVFGLGILCRQRSWSGPLLWCGRVSYSIYLMHAILLIVLPIAWPVWLGLPVLLAGTLLVSAATYHLMERPGIELGRFLEKRWLRKPVPEIIRPQPRAAA